MIGIIRSAAAVTSLETFTEAFPFCENTTIIIWVAVIASMISPCQSLPGGMSRGAIQQRMFAASRFWQSAAAASRSLLE